MLFKFSRSLVGRETVRGSTTPKRLIAIPSIRSLICTWPSDSSRSGPGAGEARAIESTRASVRSESSVRCSNRTIVASGTARTAQWN